MLLSLWTNQARILRRGFQNQLCSQPSRDRNPHCRLYVAETPEINATSSSSSSWHFESIKLNINKWSKSSDERPHRHHTCRLAFAVTRCPLRTSLQPHAAAALAVYRVLGPMRFSRGKHPPTLPVPGGRLNPHMSHGSLGPPESTSQTASPSVQLLFCGGHGCDQHTDRQTDRHTD